MYNLFQAGTRYLHYYFTASNGKGHGTHSPFVFHFITQLLNDTTLYSAYEKVEHLRNKLRRDQRILTIKDLGAGSATQAGRERTIASIARNAAKPPKYGQLLYRMVQHYQPRTVVELGTSLGITSSYLSMGNPDASVITIEGSENVAATARANFASLSLSNIRLVEGNFDNTLIPTLSTLASVDFVFVDGNHRKEPTLRYFQQLLTCVHNDTIMIFDDIHWSADMESAWEAIKSNPAVRCTIDLFFIGIVVFRQEFHEKQHFVIRF